MTLNELVKLTTLWTTGPWQSLKYFDLANEAKVIKIWSVLKCVQPVYIPSSLMKMHQIHSRYTLHTLKRVLTPSLMPKTVPVHNRLVYSTRSSIMSVCSMLKVKSWISDTFGEGNFKAFRNKFSLLPITPPHTPTPPPLKRTHTQTHTHKQNRIRHFMQTVSLYEMSNIKSYFEKNQRKYIFFIICWVCKESTEC